MGPGWYISGIGSKISRDASYLCSDGLADPIDFDSWDRYSLDGERLIPRDNTTDYFAANVTYDTQNPMYAIIEPYNNSVGGATGFKVRKNDGGFINYGYNYKKLNSEGRYEWLLEKSEDKFGNAINYSYINTHGWSTTNYHVKTIEYSQNANTNSSAFIKIKFWYQKIFVETPIIVCCNNYKIVVIKFFFCKFSI
jgi:hypothetical protein